METAQINLEDSNQQAIVSQLKYANITDLALGLRDYKGQPFDLLRFRDDDTGFISQKSLNGRALKALELPAYGMAPWPTGIPYLSRSRNQPLIR